MHPLWPSSMPVNFITSVHKMEDDLALLSYTHHCMQEYSEKLQAAAVLLELILKNQNCAHQQQEHLAHNLGLSNISGGEHLHIPKQHKVCEGEDVQAKIGKAREAFNMLTNIWKAKNSHSKQICRFLTQN